MTRLNKLGKKTIGIEPNKKLIRLAKTLNPQLNIIKGTDKEIKKLKNKVDTITMIDVLEHIKDDQKQLKEMHKMIKKNGQLILVVPANKALYGKRDKNMGHFRRYSKKELTQKLSKTGFKIRYIRYWNMLGFLPYLLSEKILKKELNTRLRTNKKKNTFEKIITGSFNQWFKNIENNLNMGFGLSLICVAMRR